MHYMHISIMIYELHFTLNGLIAYLEAVLPLTRKAGLACVKLLDPCVSQMRYSILSSQTWLLVFCDIQKFQLPTYQDFLSVLTFLRAS